MAIEDFDPQTAAAQSEASDDSRPRLTHAGVDDPSLTSTTAATRGGGTPLASARESAERPRTSRPGALLSERSLRAAALDEDAGYSGPVSLGRPAAAPMLRMDVHDASRLEWSVSLPLPASRPLDYRIEMELQIPTNVFVRHTPWDHLQSYVRLDGATGPTTADEAMSIDALRRGALAVATALAKQTESFGKRSRVLASLFVPQANRTGAEDLRLRVKTALATACAARRELTRPQPGELERLERERVLVDEYTSLRLLEFLAAADRALTSVSSSRSPHIPPLMADVVAAQNEVRAGLTAELEHRRQRGFVAAAATSLAECERYLERGSRLKKHFQEVLFLDSEAYQVADKIHHLVAAIVAIIASTWAFVWQLALADRMSTPGGRLGSGIFLLAALAGLVYAAKDRMKEVGRAWISGRVHSLYAQRVSRFRAPARRLASRDVVASARESFDHVVANLPDPLNPESSARVLATLMSYMHRGQLRPVAQLAQTGVSRVKYVFRYDLSPMFSRLDDATKPVPVFDAESGQVRFVDAPRCYHVPVVVKVSCNGVEERDVATLVLHKRGLDRLERESDAESSTGTIGVLGPSDDSASAGIDPN